MPTIRLAPAGIHSGNEQPETILARLLRLEPQTPEQKDRLSLLISKLAPLLAEAETLEVIVTEHRLEALTKKHNEIRKTGRKHSAVLAQLQQVAADAELSLRNLILAQETAINALRDMKVLEHAGQHVPRWATDAELDEWEKQIAKAQKRITKINEEIAAAVPVRNQAHAQAEAAQTEMQRIGQAEIRLRNEITGNSYRDPEFGLEVPAA